MNTWLIVLIFTPTALGFVFLLWVVWDEFIRSPFPMSRGAKNSLKAQRQARKAMR